MEIFIPMWVFWGIGGIAVLIACIVFGFWLAAKAMMEGFRRW